MYEIEMTDWEIGTIKGVLMSWMNQNAGKRKSALSKSIESTVEEMIVKMSDAIGRQKLIERKARRRRK